LAARLSKTHQLSAMLEKLGSKMRQNEPSWTKLAASCGEELPRCCQDSQLGDFVTSLDTISNDFFFAGGWE
jgi:hypothetical protein